jgi:hypothetical protein
MTHRSRQLSDDAKPPPREAVFRFGDKVERNLEQEREATMTKAPSPTTSLTPEEKLQTLFQDQALRNAERRKNPSTFSQFANSEANADAGRFAAINKANVVGAKAVPDYPNQPANSFSNQAAVVGLEEPLGFDVNETPVVGESWEVEASIEHAAQEASPNSLDADGPRVEAAGSVAHHDVEPPPNQSQTPPSRDFAKVFAPSRRKPPR